MSTACNAEHKTIEASNWKGIVTAIEDPIKGEVSRRHCEALSDLIDRIGDGECLAAELKHPIIAIRRASQLI